MQIVFDGDVVLTIGVQVDAGGSAAATTLRARSVADAREFQFRETAYVQVGVRSTMQRVRVDSQALGGMGQIAGDVSMRRTNEAKENELTIVVRTDVVYYYLLSSR